MARAKFGGSHSKLRGKLGDTIYQVVRDVKGKVMQHVYAKPQTITYSNTIAQAKQRMVIAQCQKMWHYLPQIIVDAYSKMPRGTLSFQHFTRINYAWLISERDDYWVTGGHLDWQNKYSVSAPAGEWRLTEGELPPFSYVSLVASRGRNNGIYFDWGSWPLNVTIGEIFKEAGVQAGDEIHFLFFVKYGDDENLPSVIDYKTQIDPRLELDQLMSDFSGEEIFIHSEEWGITWNQSLSTGQITLEINGDGYQPDYIMSCAAVLIVRRTEKDTLFSSSRFMLTGVNNWETYYFQSPEQAFISYKSNTNAVSS